MLIRLKFLRYDDFEFEKKRTNRRIVVARGFELEKFSFSEDAVESKSIPKEGFEGETSFELDACVCRREGDEAISLNVLKEDLGSKTTETLYSGRAGMKSLFGDKAKHLVLKEGDSANYSIYGMSKIVGK